MIRTIAAIALTGALLAGGPPACQKADSGGGTAAPAKPAAPVLPGGKACDTHPFAPHVISFAGKTSVEAIARSECDLPPVEHHVQIFLEMKVAGQWTVQPDPFGKTSGNCLDIPSAGVPTSCTWIITRCQAGLWRTRVTVFGYGPPVDGHPNGIPFNFEVPEKPEAQLTCK